MKSIRRIGPNLNLHYCRTFDQCGEKDLVLYYGIGVCVWLIRSIAHSAVAGACSGWRESIPEVYPFLGHCRLVPGLVCSNVVWKKIPPLIMRNVINVLVGTLWDSFVLNWANVMGFAVIVPGDNLIVAVSESGNMG